MNPIRLLTVVLLASASLAVVAAPDDEVELRRMLDDFLWGASIGSPAAHDRFWAADLVYTSSDGTRRDKAETMAGMDGVPEPDADTRSEDLELVYRAEDVDIRLYGTTAVVAFRLVATQPGIAAPVGEYFNTGTFLKRDGDWAAVAWQATRIPEEDAAAE